VSDAIRGQTKQATSDATHLPQQRLAKGVDPPDSEMPFCQQQVVASAAWLQQKGV